MSAREMFPILNNATGTIAFDREAQEALDLIDHLQADIAKWVAFDACKDQALIEAGHRILAKEAALREARDTARQDADQLAASMRGAMGFRMPTAEADAALEAHRVAVAGRGDT